MGRNARPGLCGGGGARARDGGSRNRRQVTGSFPELARALAATVGTRQVVLDGEVVALSVASPGAPARPSFDRLQRRMGVARPSSALRAEVPVTFVAFDLLALDDHAVTDLPWEERRRLLEGLGLDVHRRLVVSPRLEGVEPAGARSGGGHGMEGIVAKRRDAPYRPGRSHPWSRRRCGARPRPSSAAGPRAAAATRPPGRGPARASQAGGPAALLGHVGTGLRDANATTSATSSRRGRRR